MEGSKSIEVVDFSEKEQDFSLAENCICRWCDNDGLSLGPITGLHDTNDVDPVIGADAQVGQRLPEERCRDGHLDDSHIGCELHVLDQIRRHQPLHEPIRNVSLRENGCVPAHLLECFSLLVGVHLSDDLDVITLLSQHHRQQYRSVERIAKSEDHTIDIEDAEMFHRLFVQSISPNCPGHVISDLLYELLIPIDRQDVDTGAEQPGRHPEPESAQPDNCKALV